MDMTGMFKSPLRSWLKVRLLVPYGNLSTVMKGGIPRGTPSQTGVAVQATDKIHWYIKSQASTITSHKELLH